MAPGSVRRSKRLNSRNQSANVVDTAGREAHEGSSGERQPLLNNSKPASSGLMKQTEANSAGEGRSGEGRWKKPGQSNSPTQAAESKLDDVSSIDGKEDDNGNPSDGAKDESERGDKLKPQHSASSAKGRTTKRAKSPLHVITKVS